MSTTRRSVRVAAPLWEAARTAAAARGEDVSYVIRRALIEYISTTPADIASPRDKAEPMTDPDHTLTVVNAVDVPDDILGQVMRLLSAYDPDVYTRPCDESGKTL
jgi:hypothetical protein